ncbi:MAG: 23S rRNA (guanosine(2251)-2'-O)-methyltransferase RlmB [Chitinophagales bacterium]
MRQSENKFYHRKKFDNLVFGRQPVLELLNSERPVDKIILQNGIAADVISEIKKLAYQKNIPVKNVPVEKLNTLTGGVHQGIIAFTSEIEFENIEDVLPHVIEQGKTPLLLVLDGITDVRNFGAIARTAYAAGADAILISTHDAAPANAEAMKASAGALAKITVCREKDFHHTFEFLQLNGLQIIGTDSNAETVCSAADFTVPVAIVLGSEEDGINSNLRKYISINIQLPMLRKFDSYNVSVSAGMVLYEVMRQRISSK